MNAEPRDAGAYARAALDAECVTLANTAHGRNDQVNRSGFACGQFILGGHLDRGDVEDRLMAAAEASGIVQKDGRVAVMASLRSGIEAGMRQPRDIRMTMQDVGILRPRPKLSNVPLPDWTAPDDKGRPKLSFVGKPEPTKFDDEARRHRYQRDGDAVRFKIKKADGRWGDWYRVRRSTDGAIGWQARKPTGFVPVPYLAPGARDPFGSDRCGEDLVWAEGEKDVDAAHAKGFRGFTFGSASDVPDVSDLLRDHAVIVVVDNDDAGRKSIDRKIAATIKAGARSIRLVQFPELDDGGDLADYFASGKTAEDLLDRAERIEPATWQAMPDEATNDKPGKTNRRKKTPAPRGANDTKPIIAVRAGAIREAVDAAEEALMARGGLYQRGNRIVFVGEAPVKTHDEHEVMASRIFERGESALAEDIGEVACVMKWDARAEADVVIDPPARMVKTLKERVGRFRFPVLTTIINAPTLRSDGSLLAVPGYDKATGLLFDPRGVEFPAISTRPTRRDAEHALKTLSVLLGGFPFEDGASHSVAVSAILTACTRSAYPLAPLHGFSATVAGSGKGKLVDIPTVIATGREAGVTAQTLNEEEMEKRLGALLLAGASTIAIDNCTAPLDGNLICSALTQPIIAIRPFGKLDTVEVPSVAFLTATGNNLTVVGDMSRRTLVCRIDAGVERPELREFEFEPVARAKRDRLHLVSAALTILLAYQAAGSPRQSTPLGSFEEWSRMVRDALLWLGCPDPVSTMEHARATDPKLHELFEVMSQWNAVIGTDPITVRKLIDKASKQGGAGGYDFNSREFTHPDFREALLAVAGQGGTINGKLLGKWLASHAKRISSGMRLETCGVYEGSILWRLRGHATDPHSSTVAEHHEDRTLSL